MSKPSRLLTKLKVCNPMPEGISGILTFPVLILFRFGRSKNRPSRWNVDRASAVVTPTLHTCNKVFDLTTSPQYQSLNLPFKQLVFKKCVNKAKRKLLPKFNFNSSPKFLHSQFVYRKKKENF